MQDQSEEQTQMLKKLITSSECLDIIAFMLMTVSIAYTLTKYRKCSYDLISLFVISIFWVRYFFRITLIIMAIVRDRDFDYNNIFDSILSPITFALGFCTLQLFLFRIRMKKITLESRTQEEANLKLERNRKMQNIILFLTII